MCCTLPPSGQCSDKRNEYGYCVSNCRNWEAPARSLTRRAPFASPPLRWLLKKPSPHTHTPTNIPTTHHYPPPCTQIQHGNVDTATLAAAMGGKPASSKGSLRSWLGWGRKGKEAAAAPVPAGAAGELCGLPFRNAGGAGGNDDHTPEKRTKRTACGSLRCAPWSSPGPGPGLNTGLDRGASPNVARGTVPHPNPPHHNPAIPGSVPQPYSCLLPPCTCTCDPTAARCPSDGAALPGAASGDGDDRSSAAAAAAAADEAVLRGLLRDAARTKHRQQRLALLLGPQLPPPVPPAQRRAPMVGSGRAAEVLGLPGAAAGVPATAGGAE